MSDETLFPVRFRWNDVMLQSLASDVTESHFFVACPRPPPERTRLPMRLLLPDGGDPEEVEALVHAAAGDEPGFFCELITMTASGRARLRGLIPQPEPEPIEAPESLLREVAPALARPVDPVRSPLRDIVLGALENGDVEVPVSDFLAPPGDSPPRPPREAPRPSVHFKLRFANARTFVEQHAPEIISGGIFVATARSVPVGTGVLVTLVLPDGGPPIDLRARVARVDGPEEDKPGLALHFVGEDPRLSARIQTMLVTYAQDS